MVEGVPPLTDWAAIVTFFLVPLMLDLRARVRRIEDRIYGRDRK